MRWCHAFHFPSGSRQYRRLTLCAASPQEFRMACKRLQPPRPHGASLSLAAHLRSPGRVHRWHRMRLMYSLAVNLSSARSRWPQRRTGVLSSEVGL